MTDLEAILARTSRRAYSGPLPEEEQLHLEALIARLNLDSGLDFSLLPEGERLFASMRHSYGLFTGVQALVVVAGSGDDEYLQEKCGYYGQRLILDATKRGVGTCWVGGTYDRAALAGTLTPSQRLVAVITAGPVRQHNGFLQKAAARFASARSKKPEEMAATDADAPNWFWDGVEAASHAPSAMNRQPVRFAWQNGVATAAVESEEHLNLVDLGIAKLHFEIGAGGRFAPGNGAAFSPSL